MLKQGVVGAFAVTRGDRRGSRRRRRAALPRAGAPIGRVVGMIAQGAGVGAESLLAFGGSALALDARVLARLALEAGGRAAERGRRGGRALDAELAEKERKREALSAALVGHEDALARKEDGRKSTNSETVFKIISRAFAATVRRARRTRPSRTWRAAPCSDAAEAVGAKPFMTRETVTET